MKIAIVTMGVNSVRDTISLAEESYRVTIYELKMPLSETSSKSSKLLHGAIVTLKTCM